MFNYKCEIFMFFISHIKKNVDSILQLWIWSNINEVRLKHLSVRRFQRVTLSIIYIWETSTVVDVSRSLYWWTESYSSRLSLIKHWTKVKVHFKLNSINNWHRFNSFFLSYFNDWDRRLEFYKYTICDSIILSDDIILVVHFFETT